MSQPSASEKLLDGLKNHKIASAVIALGAIIIGIGSFTDALETMWSFREERLGISEDEEQYSPEDKVRELRSKAIWLKSVYEGVPVPYSDSNADAMAVREQAPFIGDQLLSIDDAKLREGYRVIKYCYAGMLFVITGQLEMESEIVIGLGKKARGALGSCEGVISSVNARADGSSKAYDELAGWLGENRYLDWCQYNQALALAFRAKAGELIVWRQIEAHLDQISSTYLQRSPPARELPLVWACENLAAAKPSKYCREIKNPPAPPQADPPSAPETR